MTDYWDNSGLAPNLSKLPLHIREGMTTPIPIRPDEVNAALMIYKQTPGLNHPNARCNVTSFRRDGSSGISIDLGAQIDFSDFTGRIALATAVISKDVLPKVIEGLLRAYMGFGGDLDAVIASAKGERQQGPEAIAFFEERNDE
jgi:hypothetical protein